VKPPKPRTTVGELLPGEVAILAESVPEGGSMYARRLLAGVRIKLLWHVGKKRPSEISFVDVWTRARVPHVMVDHHDELTDHWLGDPKCIPSSSRIGEILESRVPAAGDDAGGAGDLLDPMQCGGDLWTRSRS
jgi:hypothetical protein